MRIECPECESELSLGHPKPGSYRPKCKHCGQTFRLRVSDDEPPKFAVTKDSRLSRAEPSADRAVEGQAVRTDGHPAKLGPAETQQPESTIDATVAVDAKEHGRLAGHHENKRGDGTIVSSDIGAATIDPDIQATLETATRVAGTRVATGNRPATVDPSVTGGASVAGSSTGDFSVDDGDNKNAQPFRAGTPPVPARPAVSPAAVVSGAVVSAGGVGSRRASSIDEENDMPAKLGGYRILRLLGRGAMGAVYEAKQISLDRLVALKTIRGRLADNASSLARFTREAYAAAQLTHHNVVQIYDFGEDNGKQFFSMEWVKGGPLSELVQEKGVIDPRLAAGYILQAARGLQFAHRNGMVHRDVKPANLLLSDEGVVKVADLGLVKIPDQMDTDPDVGASWMSGMESGTQVTMQGTAVGTPAYMAPEQSIDAAGVDHRADIYSLGGTMFFLLTGQPPFDGSVVSEVMQQHANDPLPNMTGINKRVPQPLQAIVERSMAKRPEDRYGSLSEMIGDLEAFLGVSSDGKFSPTAEQADQWETLASAYSSATKMLRLAKPALAGLLVLCLLLTLFMPVISFRWLLLGPTLLISSLCVALMLDAGGQNAVLSAVRRWIGSLGRMDYAIGFVGAVIFAMVAFVAGLAPGVFVGVFLGGVSAAVYSFALIGPTRNKSKPAIQDAERFIRNLRIDGADEEGVRMFAARYGGKTWRGLFERLFGYDAMCAMREKLRSDPSFSGPIGRVSIRDRVCESLTEKTQANRQARDLGRLAKIEQRGLESEGLSESEARDRAWQMAAAVMDNARVETVPGSEADRAADAKRDRMKSMLADARSGKYVKKRSKFGVARFALGGQTRLLAGCLLLVVFAIWAQQTGLLGQVKTIAASAATDGSLDSVAVDELKASAATLDTDTGKNWSIGIAGLLLAMSSFVSGWRMSLFAVPATVVILFGPQMGIPGGGDMLQPWMVSAFVGLAIYVPGVLFGESK